MLAKLAETAQAEDATLIEVNPLIVTEDREVVALDAKVTIDGNALYRHEGLAELDAESIDDPQEAMAREKGLTYVKLDGNVGILANGAGLCMSTLDVVAQAGGAPANFLDAGGGSKAEAIVNALTVIVSDAKVTRDPLQHLRRHHPLRRDRQGDRRSVERSSTSGCRWSSASTAPTPSRGWRSSPTAGLPNLHQETTMLGAAQKVVELAGGQRLMSIIIDKETKLVVSGLTGREGSFHGLRNQAYGTDLVGGRHAGQGRPGRRGRAGLRLDPRGGRAGRAPTPR